MADDRVAPHPRGAGSSGRVKQDPTALAAAIVACAADAIVGLDKDGLITVWNGGSEALYGWSAEEMLGRGVEVLLPPHAKDEQARIRRVLSGGSEEAALETERVHKSGAIIPVSCRLSPLRDEAGEVVGACALVRDISREVELRRQLESARRVAEARFEQSVVAQATLSPAGVLLEVNEALCRLSGSPRRDLLGRAVTDFLTEPEVALAAASLGLLAAGEVPELRYPQLLRQADGRLVETRVSLFPVRDDEGAVQRLEAVIEDVSEAAAAHREVELREARWRSLASHSTDVALLCDAAGKLLFATDATWAVLGYEAAALVDGDAWELVHPTDVDEARRAWAAVVAAPRGTSVQVEFRMRHADGSWLWVEDTMSNHLDDPLVQAMVVNIVDISERKAAEAVLEELAGLDTLTGLASRAPLMASLDAAFAAGRADTTAVAVVDLTRLKLINDTYGHRGGDDVLVTVGARLARAVDGRGIVARVGGDRFAVLLTHVPDIPAMFEACAALLDVVQDPLQLGEDTLLLTATIGGAVGPAVDSGALLASAESALTTAKEGLTGPMHIVRAESSSSAVSRARLIEDLRRGLAQDELVVHFQPVVSLADGTPVAAEALVRWMHPEKGLLSPGAFIGAAEDSGLIMELGQVVLRQACRAAARWAKVGGRHGAFHVAVNLSAKQLTHGGVVDVVREALATSGAAAQNLMLEVTESAVMADVDAAVRTLQELRDLGVAIAVDDFGTGYSSMTYLKRFPVTALKIDRSFVSGLGKNDDDAAIVTSVINLARAMGLDCIAEGVETDQQRLVLQALGCGVGQGFLWSPGLDAATFETWLGSAGSEAARVTVASAPAEGAPGTTRAQPARRLPVDPAVLNRIAELGATGASLTTIAAALNADRQLTPQGKRWTSRTVAQLMATRPLR